MMISKYLYGLVAGLGLWLACCGAQARHFSPGNVKELINDIKIANENCEDDTIDLGSCTFSLQSIICDSTCLPAIGPDDGGEKGNSHTLTIKNGIIERDLLVPNLRCRHLFVEPRATLFLDNVKFRNGYLEPEAAAPNNQGGSIYNAGTLALNFVTFANNSAGFGGAVYNNCLLTAGSSTFFENQAIFDGGAVYNAATIDNLFNLTFNKNLADANGGALFNAAASIINNASNNTISGNKALANGGGIYNIGEIFQFISNIVAANTANFAPDIYDPNVGIGVAQFNLIGVGGPASGNSIPDISVAPNEKNQVGTLLSPLNPRLGPLANNGGKVFTMALLLNSPAINSGANPLGLDFDARGPWFLRTRGQTDIGAFELQLCPEGCDDDKDGICNDVDRCNNCPDKHCREKCCDQDCKHDPKCECQRGCKEDGRKPDHNDGSDDGRDDGSDDGDGRDDGEDGDDPEDGDDDDSGRDPVPAVLPSVLPPNSLPPKNQPPSRVQPPAPPVSVSEPVVIPNRPEPVQQPRLDGASGSASNTSEEVSIESEGGGCSQIGGRGQSLNSLALFLVAFFGVLVRSRKKIRESVT